MGSNKQKEKKNYSWRSSNDDNGIFVKLEHNSHAFSCSGVYICLPFLSHLKYAWICTSSSGTEALDISFSFAGNSTWKLSPLFLNLPKKIKEE